MKLAKLCLHTGGYEVPFSAVRNVRTPDETETHVPIPHAAFVEQVKNTLHNVAKLEVVNESHALAKDGDRYFGLMQLRSIGLADDYALTVGLRNSHDKFFPAGMIAGATVFVCDNLAFSGETKVTRKHTVFLVRDLPKRIELGVAKLNDIWVTQERRFETYKETTLNKTRDVDHLIMQAYRSGAMPWTQGKEVIKEWEAPSHEEFKKNNVWRLFNAFTEAGKRNSVFETPDRTVALRHVLDEFCGIAMTKKEKDALSLN